MFPGSRPRLGSVTISDASFLFSFLFLVIPLLLRSKVVQARTMYGLILVMLDWRITGSMAEV